MFSLWNNIIGKQYAFKWCVFLTNDWKTPRFIYFSIRCFIFPLFYCNRYVPFILPLLFVLSNFIELEEHEKIFKVLFLFFCLYVKRLEVSMVRTSVQLVILKFIPFFLLVYFYNQSWTFNTIQSSPFFFSISMIKLIFNIYFYVIKIHN